MTKLSPSAQAVLDAYRSSHLSINNLAAAIRAAADQIGPDGHDYSHGSIAELMWRGKREARRELLVIADELEAQ